MITFLKDKAKALLGQRPIKQETKTQNTAINDAMQMSDRNKKLRALAGK